MPRALALWIAFTGWGAMFGLTLILAAVVLGGQASPGQQQAASSGAEGPDGMFGMVTALIVQEP